MTLQKNAEFTLETNESVLQRAQQTGKLLKIVDRRQTRFLTHVIRKERVEDLRLAGRMPGKKATAWKATSAFRTRSADLGLSCWDAARDRDSWNDGVEN